MCSAESRQILQRKMSPSSSGLWQVAPKQWLPPTKLHSVISQKTKTLIFLPLRKPSNLIQILLDQVILLSNNCRKFNSSFLTPSSKLLALRLYPNLEHQNWDAVRETETVSCGACRLCSLRQCAGNWSVGEGQIASSRRGEGTVSPAVPSVVSHDGAPENNITSTKGWFVIWT